MELPFSIATYVDRLERVRRLMAEAAFDGLVTTMPDAIHWLTGFDTIGYLWPQALVITPEGEPALVTRTTELPSAAASCYLRDVTGYDIATERPSTAIAAAVRRLGLDSKRLGIELSAFTLVPAVWSELLSALPDVEWRDSSALVPEARLVKEPAELAFQRQAAEMADYAVECVLEAIRPGISEVELAGIASQALGEAGSEYAAIPPMIVSGPRTALVHALATRRSLARGDLVCVELAGVVHRYHAVVMRTASIGEPSAPARAVAACLERATVAAFEAVKPGTGVAEPDRACNEVLGELDLVRNRCHRIGYSLGIAYPPGWLEPMTLVDGDEHTFAPGMSFTIEPNLSLPAAGFGMKLGETVVCGESGVERMSRLELGLAVL